MSLTKVSYSMISGAAFNVKDYGAVGDGVTDDHAAFAAAFLAAGTSNAYGTGCVFVPNGTYVIDTDNGSLEIPEGVEFRGEGGRQVRRNTVAEQGTMLYIKGTTNPAFLFYRGVYVHHLSIDYPDQDEDPVTPVAYPYCFDGAPPSEGGKSRFENLFFDRTYKALQISGGCTLLNVHGCFYYEFISILTSAAFDLITNCSSSALWHNGTYTNTLVFQQDNLTLFKINGGSDGLTVSNFAGFVAKQGFRFVNGDNINFCSVSNSLFDGVMDLVSNDGTVYVLSVKFENCFNRMYNDHGTTYRQTPIAFDGLRRVAFSSQVASFSNCRFRASQGGIFSVSSGLDTLVLSGCTFHDWNKSDTANVQSRSVVSMEDATASLVITGGSADNTNQYDATVESRIVSVTAAKRVTVTGMDLNKVNKVVVVVAGVTLSKLTLVGNTGDDIDSGIALGTGAVITNVVDANNNFGLPIPSLDDTGTPSVNGLSIALTTGTTTITDFLDGQEGQVLVVLSQNALTITNGTNIFLSGAADFVMTNKDSLTVVQKADGFWYEIARSVV